MFQPVSFDMLNIYAATTTKQSSLHHLTASSGVDMLLTQPNLSEADSSDGFY